MKSGTPSKEQINIINNRPEQLIAKADLPLVLKPGLGRQISYSIYKSVMKRGIASIENLEAYVTAATKSEIEKVKERLKAKELEASAKELKKTARAKAVAEKGEPQRTEELKKLDKNSPAEQSKDLPEQPQSGR